MKLLIDTTERTLTRKTETEDAVFDLYSKDAFELISNQWLRVGWNQKYSYTFTWARPSYRAITRGHDARAGNNYRVRPDVVVETGVAHGGSLIFYATLCKAMGRGE